MKIRRGGWTVGVFQTGSVCLQVERDTSRDMKSKNVLHVVKNRFQLPEGPNTTCL